ncbi:MAG TPA: hypothetical protein VIK62_06140 [Verrucomicrobiae bacterium]
MFKSIRQTIAGLVEHFHRFPEMLAAALKERQRQMALIEQEAERLDRIRNPSKYRLK